MNNSTINFDQISKENAEIEKIMIESKDILEKGGIRGKRVLDEINEKIQTIDCLLDQQILIQPNNSVSSLQENDLQTEDSPHIITHSIIPAGIGALIAFFEHNCKVSAKIKETQAEIKRHKSECRVLRLHIDFLNEELHENDEESDDDDDKENA